MTKKAFKCLILSILFVVFISGCQTDNEKEQEKKQLGKNETETTENEEVTFPKRYEFTYDNIIFDTEIVVETGFDQKNYSPVLQRCKKLIMR